MKKSIIANAVNAALIAIESGSWVISSCHNLGGLCGTDNSAESKHIRNNGEPWKSSGKRKMRVMK